MSRPSLRERRQMRIDRPAHNRYRNQGFVLEYADVNDLVDDVEPGMDYILETGANRENQLGRYRRSRPSPRYRYGSSFAEWALREQFEYQRQLGSTRWNLERPIYLHPFGQWQSKVLLLKRVRACIGWAVHGLMFEFMDGTRVGYVSDVESIHDDRAIARRRPTDWVDIEPGDYVKKVHGFTLSRGCFLCHSVHFELASGQTISFESSHQPWRGDPFAHELPQDSLLQYVSFRDGKCIGLTAVQTNMHLQIHSLQRVMTLPKACQDKYRCLQLVSHRVDSDLAAKGYRPLEKDLWGYIIGEFLAGYDLQDDPSRVLPTISNASSENEEDDMIAEWP